MSKTTCLIGKLLSYLIVALVDFYCIHSAGWALFDLPQPNSHLQLFMLALIFVAVLIARGLLISLLARTQQQAMFIAIFIIVTSIL
jgi:ABC-2 type transport system permease protein